MTHTHLIRRALSIAALSAAVGGAAVGGVATAATIGAPEVLKPGASIPIDFGGYREPADNKLPANHRIVRVGVEVARGERASTVLTAPKGFRAVTIGFGEGDQIGGVASDARYSGKRSVRVRLCANPNLVGKGESGRGTVYLLARRAG